jgi:hypothetical protein
MRSTSAVSRNEFAFCNRSSSETLTSSRVMRAFCTMRRAILSSSLVVENPGVSLATINPLAWPSVTSLAQMTVRSPKVALLIHFFCLEDPRIPVLASTAALCVSRC